MYAWLATVALRERAEGAAHLCQVARDSPEHWGTYVTWACHWPWCIVRSVHCRDQGSASMGIIIIVTGACTALYASSEFPTLWEAHQTCSRHLCTSWALLPSRSLVQFSVSPSPFVVHLWHPSDPSRSQEMQQNVVSSSQALKLARALIPQDSGTDCVVLIYGQMAISHTWPSMCLASVEFASYNKS